MAVVYLIRHAQAEHAGTGVHDHDRPLDTAGKAAASEVGRALRCRDVVPDVALCSSARRATETWQALAAELDAAPEAAIEQALYLASANGLMTRLAALPEACRAALVVGHNPGLDKLIRLLIRDGTPQETATLRAGMPPGAAVAIEVVDGWPELRAGTGRLLWLVVPGRTA